MSEKDTLPKTLFWRRPNTASANYAGRSNDLGNKLVDAGFPIRRRILWDDETLLKDIKAAPVELWSTPDTITGNLIFEWHDSD